MGMIQIEGVEEALLERVRILARLHGRTVEEEAKVLLRAAAGESRSLLPPSERAAEADRIRAMTPASIVQTNSTEMVRALREEGYAGR